MRTTAIRLAATLAATATLAAGCPPASSGDPGGDDPAATASATHTEEATTEEPTPEVIEASAGDIVTDEEAELLAEGLSAYALASGELVVVDADEPLPEVLVEEVRSMVPDSWTYDDLMKTGKDRTTDAFYKTQDIAIRTGRETVMVAETQAHDINGNVEKVYWGAAGTGEVGNTLAAGVWDRYDDPMTSREEAVSYVEGLIAESENPEAYQVIVLD